MAEPAPEFRRKHGAFTLRWQAMSNDEALEVTKIYSVAGMLGERRGMINARPFRAPHHTISMIALCGGGATPRPGEISLAQHGVLFLDKPPYGVCTDRVTVTPRAVVK